MKSRLIILIILAAVAFLQWPRIQSWTQKDWSKCGDYLIHKTNPGWTIIRNNGFFYKKIIHTPDFQYGVSGYIYSCDDSQEDQKRVLLEFNLGGSGSNTYSYFLPNTDDQVMVLINGEKADPPTVNLNNFLKSHH